MQNERAQSTVTVNGEQAKQELNLLESKAIRLREALIQAGKAAPRSSNSPAPRPPNGDDAQASELF